MKRYSIMGIVLALLVVCWTSCESDDYLNDGGQANPYVDMTTYDFLKSHGKFDSLVAIIDRAGLKDLVNAPNTTFFASTDYSVAPYVSAKKQKKIIEVGNENIDFGIKDIPVSQLDSLKIYLFDGKIVRENLQTEVQYVINKFGPIADVRFAAKLRRLVGYNDYLDYVDYLNFTWVKGSLDTDAPQGQVIPPSEQDFSYDCQTSGIITTTGVLHVLSDGHRLMFNREPVASN